MEELFGLIVILAVTWFWIDSLRAREAAIRAAQHGCAEEGWQLLDETVSGSRLGLARNEEGRIGLRREYRFEFTDTGNNRRSGFLVLENRRVTYLQLQPHLYVVPRPEDPAA